MRYQREFLILCRITLEDGDAFERRACAQDVRSEVTKVIQRLCVKEHLAKQAQTGVVYAKEVVPPKHLPVVPKYRPIHYIMRDDDTKAVCGEPATYPTTVRKTPYERKATCPACNDRLRTLKHRVMKLEDLKKWAIEMAKHIAKTSISNEPWEPPTIDDALYSRIINRITLDELDCFRMAKIEGRKIADVAKALRIPESRAARYVQQGYSLLFHLLHSAKYDSDDELGNDALNALDERDELHQLADACELSIRAVNIFSDAGLKTLEDVSRKTPRELLKLKGFGQKTLMEVQKVLADTGLSLAAER